MTQKLPRAHNIDPKWVFQKEQIRITRDYEFRFSSQRTFQVRIILCVTRATFSQWSRLDSSAIGNHPAKHRPGRAPKYMFGFQMFCRAAVRPPGSNQWRKVVSDAWQH